MRILLNRRKLIAGSGGKYIKFADPEVERICVANFSSDGIGVTTKDAAAVTSIGTLFQRNTQIVTFNELEFFTGITELNAAFRNCTNLEEITLPIQCTILSYYTFRYANKLSTLRHAGVSAGEGEVNLPFLQEIVGESMFQECYALRKVTSLGSIQYTNDDMFYNDGNLQSITLPSTITEINGRLVQNSGVTTIVCHAKVPPTVNSANAFRTGSATYRITVYVPYSADHSILAAYQSASGWVIPGNGGGLKEFIELDENGNIPN